MDLPVWVLMEEVEEEGGTKEVEVIRKEMNEYEEKKYKKQNAKKIKYQEDASLSCRTCFSFNKFIQQSHTKR